MGFQLIAIGDSDVQYPLEIIKGSPVTADFNFKDIRDLKSKGSHTYNFRLPSSVANEKFFASYFMVGSYHTDSNSSFNPFARKECYLLKDTIEVFRGFIQLSNVYLREGFRYEYECIVFSSEVNFLDTIKGTTFKELDYAEWNHELTETNVYNSYYANSIDGGNLVWSLWDYGNGVASNEYVNFFAPPVGGYMGWTGAGLNMKKLRPQVRIKALIDKIMTATGYTYTSSFFDTAEFSKIYCDLNWNKADVVTSEVPPQVWYVEARNTGTENIDNGTAWANSLLDFPTEDSDASNTFETITSGGFTYSRWNCAASGTYTITLESTITPDSAMTGNSFAFKILKDINVSSYPYTSNTEDWYDEIEVGSGGTFTQTLTVYANSSDSYSIAVWCGAIANNGITYGLTDLKITVQAISVTPSSNLVYIPSLIGNLSIEKWMKAIITKFNLVVIPNKNDSTNLLIDTYDRYVDTGRTYDWSDKIDFTKDVQIVPPTKFCGKQIRFKDAKSNDYMYQSFIQNPFNENEFAYGEYIETGVKNQFADKDTKFETIFSPTINYPLNGGTLDLGVYSCAVWSASSNGDKKNVGGMRLSFFHSTKDLPDNTVYKLNLTGYSYGGADRTKYPYFSAYSEKDFSANNTAFSINWHPGSLIAPQSWDALPIQGLAVKYWRNYILDNFNVNSRMLMCNIRLSPKDIADFNFSDVITVNGQNYKVNSIKGYPVSSTGTCKVELLATFKGISVPIPLGEDDGGTGEVIECDYIVDTWNSATGIGSFVSLTTGAAATITEDCCNGLGYYWYNSKCYNSLPDGGGGEPPYPDDETVVDNDDNVVIAVNHGWTKFDILGHGNIVKQPEKTEVKGNDNTIESKTRGITIDGDDNSVSGRVWNSVIFGDSNYIDTYKENFTAWTEPLNWETTIQDALLNGENGRVLIDGDRVQSIFINGTAPGSAQRGEFVLKFRTDGSTPNNTIGQYGLFAFTDDNRNSEANYNAIKFAQKSTIRITTELVGISEETTNFNSVDKCLINSTFILGCYQQPITLYSNVESSTISTAFGSITLDVFTMIKEPYTKPISGGGMGFALDIDTFRDAANWSLKVSYETTPLIDVPNGILKYPTEISGCALWLDAANETSLDKSGTVVSGWRDLSGGNNHVSQSNATYKPSWKEDDWNRPHLDFDGSSANLNNEDAELLALSESNNTFIACYKSDVTTAEYYGQVIMGCIQPTYTPRVGLRINANGGTGAGGSDTIAYSSQSSSSSVNACNIATAGVTNVSIAVGRRDGTAVKVWDGNGNTDTGTTGADNTAVTDFCVGAASTSGTTDIYEFNGKIYELICYNRALTDAEVDKAITYLKNKWNII